MFKKIILSLLALVTLGVTASWAQTEEEKAPFSRGFGKFVYTEYEPLADKPITVYYYVPKTGDVANMRVLFVLHGAERSGKGVANMWRKFAERDGFVVIAPEYNIKIYPGWRYQGGGLMYKGKLQPREKWTYSTIEPIFDYFKSVTGSKAEKYDFWGFSAGGQFAHRFALTVPDSRADIIIAGNPGTWTFPLIDGLPSKFEDGKTYGWNSSVKDTPFANEESIKKFLARKLYVHIGKLDIATTGKYVPKTQAALSQGEHRLARARNFYETGRKIAKKNGWEFNWRKVELDDIAHSARSTVYGAWTMGEDGKRKFDINNYSTNSAYYLIFKKGWDDGDDKVKTKRAKKAKKVKKGKK